MTDLPFVSCICPTYNRFPGHGHLVEEAVESFVRQTYPACYRELLVVNDTPGQTLRCDAPGVVVVNYPARFASLGAKYNAAIRDHSAGAVILPWEDDDLSLPDRITQAVRILAEHQARYWNPQRSWFVHRQGHGARQADTWEHTHSHGVCHNASAFTRAAFDLVGGYPEISGAQDAVMDGKLKQLGHVAPPLGTDPRTWQYVYRWGVSPAHLSGVAPHDDFYRLVGERPIAARDFQIRPGWRSDYAAHASAS